MRFKALADRKKTCTTRTFEALVDEEIATATGPHQAPVADRHRRHARTAACHHEARRRRHPDHDRECTGNGPVDATFNCIKALVPNETVLELYQVHAVTEGT